MSATEDEWALYRWERELADDAGVRNALEAFDERRGRWPCRGSRSHVVTLLGAITAIALIASGTAASVLGGLVLSLAGLAVVDAQWTQRRLRRAHQMAQPTS